MEAAGFFGGMVVLATGGVVGFLTGGFVAEALDGAFLTGGFLEGVLAADDFGLVVGLGAGLSSLLQAVRS